MNAESTLTANAVPDDSPLSIEPGQVVLLGGIPFSGRELMGAVGMAAMVQETRLRLHIWPGYVEEDANLLAELLAMFSGDECPL